MSYNFQSSFDDYDIDTEASSSSSSSLSALSPEYAMPDEISVRTKNIHSTKSKNSNPSSIVVDYGPIRVFHRRFTAQTLLTGRRSKDEPLDGEEAAKREARRIKNRIASRELKKTRDAIEMDLVEKLKELEAEKDRLQTQHKELEARKAQLNRAVYNAKQAPLIPLITDLNFSTFLQAEEQEILLEHVYSLLENTCQEPCMSD
ncbi:unnamed protein product [Adineta ricciae]|uniref:BZIP domain-containing protein n=1 Tax=Adineta ricciae TaxID=249248 RepID=A0A813X6Y9_ADIRI|nr:unnamed protein product [Adineta ricciae]CAF1105251.1 unnamed protein product [Adineta ricciae]